MARFHFTLARRASGRILPASRRLPAAAAFTLMELLIVVALLAMVLTLSLPSLRKLSAKSELRTAARQLRVTLLEARLAAIDSGRPVVFRYQPGGGQFEVERGQELSAPLHRASEQLGVAEPDQFDTGSTAGDAATEPQSLPRGVRFVDPSTDRQAAPSAAVGEQPDSGSWTVPLVFYANGRTRNARIALINDTYRIELDVRGLTGTVQISQVASLPTPEAAAPQPLPEVAL
ncbi:MAG TPA: hypothetical protein PLF81_15890 [Candidatus Anammoximicrobium sp.]|nr:hypothetical protein [Candidatus Anammoximicrobium sp.]